MGCRTAPLGELGVPVPMTSSALTRSGATGSPAASEVPISCGVRAFDDTLGQSAFEESVQAAPSYIPCHISYRAGFFPPPAFCDTVAERLRSVQAWTSVMPCLWQSNEFDSEKGRGRTVAPASLQTRSFGKPSHPSSFTNSLRDVGVDSRQIPSLRRHCINAPVRPRLWAPAP